MNSIVKTLLRDSAGNEFVFDAVFSADHAHNVTVTQHPVQSGAAVADHAFVNPVEVTMDIGFSDVNDVRYYFEAGQTYESTYGAATAGRSVSAYELFLEIMEAREPVTLVTRLKTYDNMMITAISASDSAQTMFGLRASVSLQQIRRVSVATMSIQQTCSSSKITYEQADTSNAWNGFVSPEVVLGSLYGDSDYSGTTSTTPIYPSGSSSSGGSNSSILNDIWDWASGIWRS